MERVDQPGAPTAARRQGGQPPYRASLGHVRVDQPCAALVQQPADDEQAPQVSGRPDWAHQWDVSHRDIWVGELPFSLSGAASGEDGRELGREALRQQDRLSSGTADVHACDETQDRRTRCRGGVGLNAWHLSSLAAMRGRRPSAGCPRDCSAPARGSALTCLEWQNQAGKNGVPRRGGRRRARGLPALPSRAAQQELLRRQQLPVSGPERFVERAGSGIGALSARAGLPGWALPAGAAVFAPRGGALGRGCRRRKLCVHARHHPRCRNGHWLAHSRCSQG